MAWGATGKYWNVGLSDPGRLAATSKQLWTLHLLSGRKVDYRGQGLTREEASDLITRMRKEREQNDRDLVIRDAFFDATFSKAVKAANEAGDAWFEQHPDPIFEIYDPENGKRVAVHDRLGEVVIQWPKGTVFGRWAKGHAFNGQYRYLYIPHRYHGRPEYGLQKATTEAAFNKLSEVVVGLKMREQDFWS